MVIGDGIVASSSSKDTSQSTYYLLIPGQDPEEQLGQLEPQCHF